MRRETHDPYAAPPRHKERSGAVVRFAIIAALLGAAAWGYMEYAQQPQTALVPPEQEQRVADSGYDAGYQAEPMTPAAPSPTETLTQTPAEPSQASPPPSSDPPA